MKTINIRNSTLVILALLFYSGLKAELQRDKSVGEALERLKINPQKLSFNLTFTNIDSFRFRFVNYLLQHPLKAIDFADTIAKNISSENKPSKQVYALYSTSFARKPVLVIKKGGEEYPWKNEQRLTPKLKEGLNVIYDAIVQANEILGFIKKDFTPQQRDSLFNFVTYILELDADDAEKKAELTVEEEDSLWKEEYRLTNSVLSLVAKIDRTKIIESGLLLLNACELALVSFSALSVDKLTSQKGYTISDVSGDVFYYTETPYGALVIGGPGRTVYKGRFLLIVDLGGDDEYRFSAGGADTSKPISIAIDLSGNDIYNSREPYAFGSGFLGVGILFDCAGNDSYNGRNFSLGAGVCGFGALYDIDGDDIYRGDTGCEGAGYAGLGILSDTKGNDIYIANFASQGFAFVGGIGAIYDGAGNDIYIAQGKYPDRIRRSDHYLSMAQGFGFGSRPNFSGGLGILVDDGDGSDNYVCDVFGQGASYWYAFGALIDKGGSDTYTAYQYAQGCGTHFTLGLILDYAGDDNYSSHSVSQGCGHDIALGVLNDRAGDDNYLVYDLSQGAGNANGIGIFIDEKGNDSYIVRETENTQGYGNFRREYGSIGLMLDLGGKDGYIGKGKDESEWMSGKYGIGIDYPTIQKK